MLIEFFQKNPGEWDEKYAGYIKDYPDEVLREIVYMPYGRCPCYRTPAEVETLVNILKNIKDLSSLPTLVENKLKEIFDVLLIYKAYQEDDPSFILKYHKFYKRAQRKNIYCAKNFQVYTPFRWVSPLPYYENGKLKYLADYYESDFDRINVTLYLLLLFRSKRCADELVKNKNYIIRNFGKLRPIFETERELETIDFTEQALLVRVFMQCCRSADGIDIIFRCSEFITWTNTVADFFFFVKYIVELFEYSKKKRMLCENRFHSIVRYNPIPEKGNFDWLKEIENDGEWKKLNISGWFDDVDRFVAKMLVEQGLEFLGLVQASSDEEVENCIRRYMSVFEPKRKGRPV